MPDDLERSDDLEMPADFDKYWSAVDDELAALPPAPELEHLPLHSDENATVYGARFTSIGPYRLWAWFSVPTGEGPFPALYRTPNYGSVVNPPGVEDRQRYVILALCHRGQRHADQPYAADYPGLLTDGITDPHAYVYRGIVADCLRGYEFLRSRPEVDPRRMAVVGDDLALLVAARRPDVPYLSCTTGPFYRALARSAASSAYPLEELNDFRRSQPDRGDALGTTVSYFDPARFAPAVRAETRVVTGAGDEDLLLTAFSSPVETYQTARSGFRDGVAEASWLAGKLGLGEPLLPSQWRS